MTGSGEEMRGARAELLAAAARAGEWTPRFPMTVDDALAAACTGKLSFAELEQANLAASLSFALGDRAGDHQALDRLAQGRIVEARREIDDAAIGHRAIFGDAVDGVGGKAGRGHDATQSATSTCATNAGSRTVWPEKGEPSSNHERGAGAPHSVCRRGSRSDQRNGSWSWSIVK